jgi:hypothetical protein
MQFSASDDRAAVLCGDVAERVLSLDLEVGDKHLIFLRSCRFERRWLRRQNRLPGYGKNAEVELRIDQPAWLVRSHIDTKLLE